MRSSKCKVHSSGSDTLNCELRTLYYSGGFTYVAVLAAIVIIGISLGAAGKHWSSVMQRDREEELLFRGEQYRFAIEQYYLAKAPHVFPAMIEQLLKDDRFPQAKRHLRREYKDPITGKDFEIIKDVTKGNRITGVFSPSDKEPIKKKGFPEQYQSFENKNAYKEWQFVFSPAPVPGQPAAPPAPRSPPPLGSRM